MEQDTNAAFEAENEGIIFDVEDFGLADEGQDTNAGQEAGDEKQETAQDTNAAEEKQDAEEKGDVFECTYLGEKKQLSRDEAIEYAQKGLNYDHIKEQLDALKGNELYKAAIESAKTAGMTEAEFAQQLRGQLKDREISKISKERNVDEDTARGIYESECKAANELEKANEKADELSGELDELREYKRVNELREEMRKQWMAFTAEHPEIKTLDDLPKEVSEAVKAGQELDAAYAKHELKQLKEQIAREHAKAKSAGSARSNAAPEDGGDFFLKGFLGND